MPKDKKTKKPLVNWFKREKEFEFSEVKNKKGESVINKKTGKPLTTTTKRVTAPDSRLSSGFTKEVKKEQKIVRTPAKRQKVRIPVSVVAPTLLGWQGTTRLAKKIGNEKVSKNAGSALLAATPAIAGSLTTIAMAKHAAKNDKFLTNKEGDSVGKRVAKGAANLALGGPVMYDVGTIRKKAKEGVKTTKTVTKVKNKNKNSSGGRNTPRFM